VLTHHCDITGLDTSEYLLVKAKALTVKALALTSNYSSGWFYVAKIPGVRRMPCKVSGALLLVHIASVLGVGAASLPWVPTAG